MKKIVTLGLAALMAVSATAASTDAFAKDKWQKWPHKPNWQHSYSHRNNNDFFFAAPLFFGLGLGLGQAYPRYHSGYNASYGSAHVQWCLNRYRTYNPGTNTFFIRKGVPAVCVSPYWNY